MCYEYSMKLFPRAKEKKDSKYWNYRWNHVVVDIVGLFQIPGVFHFACIYVCLYERVIYIHSYIIFAEQNKIYKKERKVINIKMEYAYCMLNGLKRPFVQKKLLYLIWHSYERIWYAKQNKNYPKCWTCIFYYSIFSSTETHVYVFWILFEREFEKEMTCIRCVHVCILHRVICCTNDYRMSTPKQNHFEDEDDDDDASSIQTVIYCVDVTMCRYKANRKSSNNKTANIRHKHAHTHSKDVDMPKMNWRSQTNERNERKAKTPRQREEERAREREKIKPKTLSTVFVCICAP